MMNLASMMLLLALANHAQAMLHQNHISDDLSQEISYRYIEDKTGKLSAANVLLKDPLQWSQQSPPGLNKGIGKAPHWLYVSLTNPAQTAMHRLMIIDYSQLDYVDVYSVNDGRATLINQTGDRRPFHTRLHDHPEFIYQLDAEPQQTLDYLIRISTESAFQVPILIWQEQAFYENALLEQKLQFTYYGALLVMAILNLFIFAMLKEKTYLYYSCAMMGFLMFFLSLRGFTFEIFWPDSPSVHHQILATSLPFIAIFSMMFCRSFLNTKERNPKYDRLLLTIISLDVVWLFASFIVPYAVSLKVSAVLTLAMWLALTCIGPVEWYRGNRMASFYTIAWTLLSFGFALTALNKTGVIPSNFLTEYGMQLGSAIEATILTMALADRLYHERENKLLTNLKLERESRGRREAEFQLIHQSLHHPITKLPNRNHLEMVINDTIELHPDLNLSVCIIKLSNFGEVTRTLGYHHADELLSVVADSLNETVRSLPGIIGLEDDGVNKVFLSSFEGASFGVVVKTDALARSKKQLEKVMKRAYEPILFNGLKLELGPLFGVSAYPSDGRHASILLRHANVALEQANQSRNRLSRYRPENDKHNYQQLTLMAELKTAIAEDQLELYYQPKLDSNSNRLVGMEALLRWHHHQFGFVSPDEFIPVAEKTGLIHDVTRWVLQKAIFHLEQIHKAGHKISVSVNLSPLNLMEETLPDFLEDLLGKCQVDRSYLIIELTETSTMDEPEKCLDVLNHLQQLGFKISIDDFGSGYSSLTYLKNVPATEIKIDKSLILDLVNQNGDQIIVKTTIDMCHSLGYQVTAEGVENKETRNLLQELNCDFLQGYYFARPVPYDSMLMWLESFENHSKKLA